MSKEDADLDEKFVLDHKTEDEEVYSKSHLKRKSMPMIRGISIQMAARELRYTWFDELRKKYKCDFIVTAHHLDDQVETFFIQLLRKASLPGLSGMPVMTDKIIRPLMFMGRESIETLCGENENIPYREDKSNASDVYLRNRIRRNLIPVMQKVLPDFKMSVLELMGNMKEVSDSLEQYFERKEKDIVESRGEERHISIQGLNDIDFPLMFLEYYLRPFGFNQATVKNIYGSLESESGKAFYSSDHMIAIKDRDALILAPLKKDDADSEMVFRKHEPGRRQNLIFKSLKCHIK